MAMGRSCRLYEKKLPNTPYSIILENARCNDDFLLFESGVVASLGNLDLKFTAS